MEAVKESPRGTLSSAKMAALAAGLSVGVTVGYFVYRHVSSNSGDGSQQANAVESRMSVPLEVYRNISRYQASFQDIVIKKSGANVRVVSDSVEPNTPCTSVGFLLQGTPEQVLLARCALENLASDCEPASDFVEVPRSAFGRIIGRGGESLKLITRTSGARVSCPKERGRSPEEMGKVSITGTRLEVRQAKGMILDKVTEDQAVRRKISQSSALRQKRRLHDIEVPKPEATDVKPAFGLNNNGPCSLGAGEEGGEGLIQADGTTATGEPETVEGEPMELKVIMEEHQEDDIVSPDSLSDVSKFEIPGPDLSFQPDEHLEVYVSASENPHHFWIQILGVRSLQLDKLTEEMSRFYSNGTLPEQRVETIVVGDIVAAPYKDLGTWNRARVLGVLGSGLVDLYFVDYGDNGELSRENLRSMRSDFLSLPFQAIECSLAGVRPLDDVWTEAALDEFDRLTYCSEWRPLLAKLCSYSHSEISSWPSVKLYDNSEGKAVDLGEELVRLGHAVCCQETGDERGDRGEPGSLQRMLDDVTGATSELSLSCISLSGPPPPSGEGVSEQGATSNASSSSHQLRWLEGQGTERLSSGPGFVLYHSTPAVHTERPSLPTESHDPTPLQSYSPDQEAPREGCLSPNHTHTLYESGSSLQHTHTLSSSPTSSASSFYSASSSPSPLSDGRGSAVTAIDSMTLSDEVFAEGMSYDGDAEGNVTESSGDGGTTGESSWSLRSSGVTVSFEDYSGEEVISISSSPTSSRASSELSSQGDESGEGSRGSGLGSSSGGPCVIMLSDSSSHGSWKTGRDSDSDVVCMGSLEPAGEGSSCDCCFLGGEGSEPSVPCGRGGAEETPGVESDPLSDGINSEAHTEKSPRKDKETGRQVDERQRRAQPVACDGTSMCKHSVSFLSSENEAAHGGLDYMEAHPQPSTSNSSTTRPRNQDPNKSGGNMTGNSCQGNCCREVASISGSVDDVVEDDLI